MFVDIFCQCCLNKCDDKVNMSSPVNNQGILEVYEEMLQYSTGIKLQKQDNINYICKPCICKLRESCIFKNQVQEVQWRLSINSLKNYLQTVPDHNYDDYFNPFVEIRNGSKSQPALFKCEICLAKFNTQEDYDLHTEYCNNEIVSEHDKDDASYRGFSDPDRDYNYEINITRNLRNSKSRPKELKYTCRKCSAHFNNKKDFKLHRKSCDVKKAVQKKELKCKHCAIIFNSKEEYKLHMKSCKEKLICQQCGKIFIGKFTLSHHLKTHNPIRIKCEICGKEILNYLMKSHLKRHKEKPIFPCSLCDQIFNDHHPRVMHMVEAHGAKKPEFRCHLCPATYTKNGLKLRHIRRTHLKIPKAQCPVCQNWYPDNCTLKKHMIIHGERNLKCDVCHKAFNRKDYLAKHLLTHNNFKNYKCPICGKAYKIKSYLASHLKTHK